MIGYPRSPGEFEYCKEFMFNRGHISVPQDAHILLWMKDGKPAWIVAMSGWVGLTCQMSFVNDKPSGFLPRNFTSAVFNYAFNTINRRYVFITINSENTRSLRLNRWLGFEEIHKAESAYEDGADLIVMMMAKDRCRWIKETSDGRSIPKRLSTNS